MLPWLIALQHCVTGWPQCSWWNKGSKWQYPFFAPQCHDPLIGPRTVSQDVTHSLTRHKSHKTDRIRDILLTESAAGPISITKRTTARL